MKKIALFVVAALFVSFTFGQQTINPDIQKLLQKRLKEQQDQKLKELNPFLRKTDKITPAFPQNFPQTNLLNMLSDGSKIFALPLDNMPCIEPDMSKYDNMPNLAMQKKHQLILPDNFIIQNRVGRTPNAGMLKKILPDDINK